MTQTRAADRWGYLFYLVGAPTAALAALAGGSAIADNTTLAAGLAIGAASTSSLWAFLNPGGKAAEHGTASCHFRSLENRARAFASVAYVSQATNDELAAELNKLVEAWNKVDDDSPHVAQWLVSGARRKVDRAFDVRGDQANLVLSSSANTRTLPKLPSLRRGRKSHPA